MTRLNWSRILLGGLAAGFVMNVIDATTNGFLLAEAWRRETDALNAGLIAKAGAMGTIGWIVFDFICGIITVWLYAAIRSHYGPGPKTAMIAGSMVWLTTHIAFASLWFMGLYSATLVLSSSVGGLAAALAGAYVGGLLYKEAQPGAVTAPRSV